jgi:hypothetical protein
MKLKIKNLKQIYINKHYIYIGIYIPDRRGSERSAREVLDRDFGIIVKTVFNKYVEKEREECGWLPREEERCRSHAWPIGEK